MCVSIVLCRTEIYNLMKVRIQYQIVNWLILQGLYLRVEKMPILILVTRPQINLSRTTFSYPLDGDKILVV